MDYSFVNRILLFLDSTEQDPQTNLNVINLAATTFGINEDVIIEPLNDFESHVKAVGQSPIYRGKIFFHYPKV